jgi:hypothetical protein
MALHWFHLVRAEIPIYGQPVTESVALAPATQQWPLVGIRRNINHSSKAKESWEWRVPGRPRRQIAEAGEHGDK